MKMYYFHFADKNDLNYVFCVQINGSNIMYKTFERSKLFKTFKKCFGFLLAKKPKIVFRGSQEEISEPVIFLGNHGLNGSVGLYANEIYFPFKFTPVGRFEVFQGFRKRWSYLYTFNHRLRRGLGKFKAFCCATFDAVFSKAFYRYCRAIPSYQDNRLVLTYKQVFRCLNEGISVMIYPELLDMGYNNTFLTYLSGFVSIAKTYNKKEGKEVKICATYYSESTRQIIIDEPISIIDMLNDSKTKEEIATYFSDRTNNLYKDYVLPIHQEAEKKYKRKYHTEDFINK